MTQKSIPWPGVAPDSGDDAGRYTAPEWWAIWASFMTASGIVIESPLLRTLAGFTNFGVLWNVQNRLVVTSPANNQIQVDTGAWMADGQFGYNDTIAGSGNNITSPAANPRIDRVVVRKNYGAATYDPAFAGAEFDVAATTARITIVHGAEAASPVAPALVQDTTRATYWDIPLAQYEISTGGVISSLTDQRHYIAPGMSIIEEQVGDGVATTLTFDNIPQSGFKSLKIVGTADVTSGSPDLYLRFNNDSTATNYEWMQAYTDRTGTNQIFDASDSEIEVTPSLQNSLTIPAAFRILIPDYLSTALDKTVICESVAAGDPWPYVATNGGWFAPTSPAAINRIDLILSGNAWDVETVVTLYGIV